MTTEMMRKFGSENTKDMGQLCVECGKRYGLHFDTDCPEPEKTLAPAAPVGLPTDPKERKAIPIYSGFIKYFPDAIAAVAELSRIGNDQHNPGKPLHWDRSKSSDELDAMMRHVLDEANGVPEDTDGVKHATKAAWRAMAHLQKLIEAPRTIGFGTTAVAPEAALGWREWKGGDCPVRASTMVEVRLRSRYCNKEHRASDWNWKQYGGDGDIIAWRLA